MTIPPKRIWIDEHGGNWSSVSGGTQSHEYIRAYIANAEIIKLRALLDEAVEALDHFQTHYPHGINPWLDDAANKARATLVKIKEARHE